MLISDSNLLALRRGLQTTFTSAFDAVSANELWYKLLASEVQSKSSGEVYYANDTLIRLRKWLGPRQVNNVIEKSYLLDNEPYEGTFAMSVDDVEDDKFGSQDAVIRNLGRAARLWPNDLVYAAIAAGGATVCYDGQYFFDTDHPLEVQGAAASTQANLHTSTALTVANFQTVYTAMVNRYGNDGKPLGVIPTHLVIPAALRFTANMVVKSTMHGYNANASSTASDSNPELDMVQILVVPDLVLNSSTTWYLADLSKPLKPFVFQNRQAPNKIVMLNEPNDEGVFESNEIRYGVKGRGAAGYGLWQLIDKCTA